MSSEERLRAIWNFDYLLFGIFMVLILLGLMVLYSLTWGTERAFMFEKQLKFLIIFGFPLFIAGYTFSMKVWRVKSMVEIAYGLSLLLLIIVLFLGIKINEARRWIRIGSLTIQPSEIAKLTVVLMLAKLFYRLNLREEPNRLIEVGLPVLIISFPVIFIFLEPSISAGSIVLIVSLLLLFFVQLKWHETLLLGSIAALFLTLLILVYPHARTRVEQMIKGKEMYQVKQAKIAIVNGGFLGRGAGRGYSKFNYLPEVSNDFVFASIVEEWGGFTGLIIILLFSILTVQGMKIGMRWYEAGAIYEGTITLGITLIFSIQALLHIMVNLGLLPPTGIGLPFISYGKFALVLNMFMAGMLLRLSEDSQEIEEEVFV